jgi:hypothetical protein
MQPGHFKALSSVDARLASIVFECSAHYLDLGAFREAALLFAVCCMFWCHAFV